jgi:ABC-type branched-subunit amino acid transport system substrate-binding protein
VLPPPEEALPIAGGRTPLRLLDSEADLALLTPAPVPGSPPPTAGIEGPPVRVGLLVPLSGRLANLGEAMLDAAQLALFEVADPRFELLPYDVGDTAEAGSKGAERAIADGAQLLIGPLLSTSTAEVAPIAQAAGVPVISFSNDRAIAGNGVYLFGFTPDAQVRRVVAFARAEGYRRFAVIAPDNAYGAVVVDALYAAASLEGAAVTAVELHDPRVRSFDEIVKRLAAAPAGGGAGSPPADPPRPAAGAPSQRTHGFDALLVAHGGRQLHAIAALLPYYGIDPQTVRMLGTGAWDEPGTGREPALVGGWFAVPPTDARAPFTRKFEQTYGRTPPRLASLAYDATALAAVLVRTRGPLAFDPASLTSPNGFAGSEGIFRFPASGVAERGLAVMEVRNDGASVVSSAPQSF